MFHRRLLLSSALYVLLPLVAPACSSELFELNAAHARWKALTLESYDFELTRACLCPDSTTAHLVEVRNGKVSAVRRVSDGLVVPLDKVPWVLTVDQLFEQLSLASREAASWSAEYDPRTGVPARISIDWILRMADDEDAYTARLVRPSPTD